MKKSGVFLIIFSLLFGLNTTLTAQHQLTGTVNYNSIDTLPVPQVTLGLYDLSDLLVASTMTDDNGSYLLSNIPSGEYYLRSSTNLAPSSVSIQDSYLVLMYLLNWIELDDIQYEAADVNDSGTVTWSDYFYIVINYLLYGDDFPAGEWQFEEVYVDFTSRDAPPDTSKVWAISTGDVEGAWEPSGRELKILDFTHYPVQVTGTELQLEIKSNISDELAGFSINLSYPTNQFNIVDITGPDNNLNYVVDQEKGIVRVIWLDENNSGRITGDHLFTLVVETKGSDFEVGAFETLTGSMIMDAKGTEIKDVVIQLPMLEMVKEAEVQVTTYPNPVVNELHIRVNLDEAASASIMIFDAVGKLVLSNSNMAIEKGEHIVAVDTQKLKAGHYFYTLELSGSNYKTSGRIVKAL